MEIINKNRKGYLDIAKAIGIIIVLINHIELSLGRANQFLGVFFVSEFFVLSGMTFHRKAGETLRNFAVKKAKRLLLPYAVYSAFYLAWYTLRSITSGTYALSDFGKKLAGCIYARTYLFPAREHKVYLMEIMNAPMWFLPALFVALVVYYMISVWLGEKKKWGVFAALGIALICHYVVPILLPWSIDTAMAMLVLLYAGERLAEKDYITTTRKHVWVMPVMLLAFLMITMVNGSGNISVGDYGRSMLLFLISSFLGTFLCIMLSFFIEKYLHFLAKVFMIIGVNTMDILCLHLFVFALMQTVLGGFKVPADLWIFKLIIIIAGIIIPVIVVKGCRFILELGNRNKGN